MTSAQSELERLLAESVPAAKMRAASAFDEIAAGSPVIIFGAGGLGRRTAEGLARLGRPAIGFADNNPARAGGTFCGLPVMATRDAIDRFGSDAVFVVAVWRSPATENMSERIETLRALGAKRVTSFAALGWKYPEQFLPYYSIDLPHRVLEHKEDIFRAFELLSDEPSRQEYVAHVRLRLHLDFAGLRPPANEPEYFAPDLFSLSNDERFVDCGAFDGDTVRSFLSLIPNFTGRVHAFEPDAASFGRLESWRDAQTADLRSRIAVTRAGVGAERARVAFSDDGSTGSAVGKGAVEIDIVPLDEVVLASRPTLVKVDTEGYEPEVLQGARELIETQGPTLALCVYHRQDHPWRIPLMVHAIRSDYRYTLRNYCCDGWDLVLYAVPEHRR